MKKLLSILKSPVALPAEAPEWWQVIPYGEVLILGDDEPKIMDDETAPLVIEYFRNLGRDMVIDYEHQTLLDVQAPAAGWIKEFDWRGKDGMWVRSEWTAKAAGYIENKEYRYFSPVMVWRESDRRIIALINVALTNEPRTRNIAAIAAKVDIESLTFKKEDENMDFLKKLIAKLKLKPEATEDQVLEEIDGIAAKNTTLDKKVADLEKQVKEKPAIIAAKSVLDALKLDEKADEKTIIAKIGSLSAGDNAATDLAEQVRTLTDRINTMETDDLTAQALKNGQTSPEELDKWGRDLAKKDPERFKLIVLSRAHGSVIPVDKLGEQKKKGDANTLDDTQVSINKMMGIDEETWKKFGPKEAA